MTTATDKSAVQTFAPLALDKLRPSKANPRRTFNEKGLKDLEASIREKGVLAKRIAAKKRRK